MTYPLPFIINHYHPWHIQFLSFIIITIPSITSHFLILIILLIQASSISSQTTYFLLLLCSPVFLSLSLSLSPSHPSIIHFQLLPSSLLLSLSRYLLLIQVSSMTSETISGFCLCCAPPPSLSLTSKYHPSVSLSHPDIIHISLSLSLSLFAHLVLSESARGSAGGEGSTREGRRRRRRRRGAFACSSKRFWFREQVVSLVVAMYFVVSRFLVAFFFVTRCFWFCSWRR